MFGIKGLAARIYFAFILSSPSAPAVAPGQPGPYPEDASHQEQEWGRGAARGTCGTDCVLRAPVNRTYPGPDPTIRFRRLPWVPCRSCLQEWGGVTGNLGVKQELTGQAGGA
jgi:hypothetical protein